MPFRIHKLTQLFGLLVLLGPPTGCDGGGGHSVSDAGETDAAIGPDSPMACRAAPTISALGSHPGQPASCETLSIQGTNLDCAGTRIELTTDTDPALTDAAEIVASTSSAMTIRLPWVSGANTAYRALAVHNDAGTAGFPLVPALPVQSALSGSGTCPPGPRPACDSLPQLSPSPNGFAPHVGPAGSCMTVILLGAGVGCAGVAVGFGNEHMEIADAYLGPDRLAVRFPATVPAGPATFVLTLEGHEGTVESTDRFTVLGPCAP